MQRGGRKETNLQHEQMSSSLPRCWPGPYCPCPLVAQSASSVFSSASAVGVMQCAVVSSKPPSAPLSFCSTSSSPSLCETSPFPLPVPPPSPHPRSALPPPSPASGRLPVAAPRLHIGTHSRSCNNN